MTGQHLRVGSVPYLNAHVLVHDLAGQNGITLEFAPPSLLARKLAAGQLDVALASSIEYLRHHEYSAVPGLSISGRREMWSIQLFHRVPLNHIRTLALDPASETTNALVKLLLKERWDLEPTYVSLEEEDETAGDGKQGTGDSSPLKNPSPDPLPQRKAGRQQLLFQRVDSGAHCRSHLPFEGQAPGARCHKPATDAILLIGDAALAFKQPGWEAIDLLSVWHELTALPFVFAVWQARPGVNVEALGARLRRCRDDGLKQAPAIAKREAHRHGMTLDRTLQYISTIVQYDLGEEERSGLRRFQEYLLKHHLLEAGRPDL